MKSNKISPKLPLQKKEQLNNKSTSYHSTLSDHRCHLGLFRLPRVHQLAQDACPGSGSQKPGTLGEDGGTGSGNQQTNFPWINFRNYPKSCEADFQDFLETLFITSGICYGVQVFCSCLPFFFPGKNPKNENLRSPFWENPWENPQFSNVDWTDLRRSQFACEKKNVYIYIQYIIFPAR